MAAGGSYRSARPPRAWLAQDLDSLCELYRAALSSTQPKLPDEFITRDVVNLRVSYLAATQTMVIGGLGDVEGFISLKANWIMGLFVHPKAQRRGLGRDLMGWAKTQSDELLVEVFAENEPALRFYTAESYRKIAVSQHPETNLPLVQLRWRADRQP